MKFNEKLIELRKKLGLSQEMLGEKLNVTRQTISKWELGQTTPSMDMLFEMSKLFNVSADELMNDNEVSKVEQKIIEDQPIIQNKAVNKNSTNMSREKIIVGILVTLLVVAIAVLLLNIAKPKHNLTDNTNKTEVTGEAEGFIEKFFGLFETAFKYFTESTKEFDVAEFNNPLSIHSGLSEDLHVRSLLDKIITSNKTNERKVSVFYEGVETQDETEIRNIKNKIDGNYEVVFDYDSEGYIIKASIEKTYTKFDISMFNTLFEMSAGTNYGSGVSSILDNIVTVNKTKERKITVVYGKIETQDEIEIKDIKKEIGLFTWYDITFEYDEIGFINKIIIEKM